MANSTNIRFKGYVKPKFRKDFSLIALTGDWKDSNVEAFKKFGELFSRASMIPCGIGYDSDWERIGGDSISFENSYNEETGHYIFQCSLIYYDDTVGAFMELVPYFIEKIEHFECFDDSFESSWLYDLNAEGNDLRIVGSNSKSLLNINYDEE